MTANPVGAAATEAGGGGATDPTGATTDATATDPVVVARGDITSVLVVDGSIVSRPAVSILAPKAGTLTRASDAQATGRRTKGAVLAAIGRTAVTMPFEGTIDSWAIASGEHTEGHGVLATAAYAGFGVDVTVPTSRLYRLYTTPVEARVNIESGPSGIPCTPTPASSADAAAGSSSGSATGQGESGTAGAGTVSMVCLLPQGTAAVEGLSARVGLTTGSRTNVLILPVSAVSGSAQQGQVTKVTSSGNVLVDIGLGMTDGALIEVTSGLREGDKVLPYAPSLG